MKGEGMSKASHHFPSIAAMASTRGQPLVVRGGAIPKAAPVEQKHTGQLSVFAHRTVQFHRDRLPLKAWDALFGNCQALQQGDAAQHQLLDRPGEREQQLVVGHGPIDFFEILCNGVTRHGAAPLFWFNHGGKGKGRLQALFHRGYSFFRSFTASLTLEAIPNTIPKAEWKRFSLPCSV